MNLSRKLKLKRNQRGQILVLLAVMLPSLLLLMGLAIDLGLAYVTKTTLSKAADAAALAALRNINQGTSRATTIAQSAFNLNYPTVPGANFSTPTVTVALSTDSSGNTIATVTATATINTYFLKILPQYKTLTVSSSTVATRPKVIMSLVLDKSYSMTQNGGQQALPPAVSSFLSFFDDSTDQVGEVSFSTIASVDVSMRSNFTSTINNSVSRLQFNGFTFSQAGLLDGQTQITSTVIPAGQNVLKVAVFFTDGWPNTANDNLSCPTSTNLNYSECDVSEQAVGWCDALQPTDEVVFYNPSSGNAVGTYVPPSGPSSGCSATSFPSQRTGSTLPMNDVNIPDEAVYRAIQVGNAMRAQNITVYAIGLGDKINQSFLQQVANDPASSSFNSSQPIGSAIFAPSSTQLEAAFQTIASKILLRISQ